MHLYIVTFRGQNGCCINPEEPMPTYTVTTANLSLSAAQKGQIAEAITAAGLAAAVITGIRVERRERTRAGPEVP